MTIYFVVINDDTTGAIDTDTLDGKHPDNFLGDYVTIQSHDENGNQIECYGKLTGVLYEES